MASPAKELIQQFPRSVQNLFTTEDFDPENATPEQVQAELSKHETSINAAIAKNRNLVTNGANESIKQKATRDLRQGRELSKNIKKAQDIVTKALNNPANKPTPSPEPSNVLSKDNERAEAEKKLYKELAMAKQQIIDAQIRQSDFNRDHKSHPFMPGDTNLVNLFYVILFDIINNDNIGTPRSILDNIKKAWTDYELIKNKRIDNPSSSSSTSESTKDPAGLALDSFDENPGVSLTPIDENNNAIGPKVRLENIDTAFTDDDIPSRFQLEIAGANPENAELYQELLESGLEGKATVVPFKPPVPAPSGRPIQPIDPLLAAASIAQDPSMVAEPDANNDADDEHRLNLIIGQ